MSAIAQSKAAELKSLLETLKTIGIADNHTKVFNNVTSLVTRFFELDGRSYGAVNLTAPQVDTSELRSRLSAGKDVGDSELIEAAVKASAAEKGIGSAVQSLLNSAADDCVRTALREAKGSFREFVDAIRQALADAGPEPSDSLIRNIRNALQSMDSLAGRDQCDFWCLYNAPEAKWEILERDEAEALNVRNEEHAQAEKARAAKLNDPEANVVRPQPRRKPTRNLRRKEVMSSSIGGYDITASDVANYAALKAATPSELTR